MLKDGSERFEILKDKVNGNKLDILERVATRHKITQMMVQQQTEFNEFITKIAKENQIETINEEAEQGTSENSDVEPPLIPTSYHTGPKISKNRFKLKEKNFNNLRQLHNEKLKLLEEQILSDNSKQVIIN